MKHYNNYIIRTNKNSIELIKYVREYYEKQFKYGILPFWKTVEPRFQSADAGAEAVADYLLQCYYKDLVDDDIMDLNNDVISFLCTVVEGAFSNAFSSAFNVATTCGQEMAVFDFNSDFNLDFESDFDGVEST